MVILRSSITQIVITLLLSLVFTYIYLLQRPFVRSSDNRIAIVCQVVLNLTLMAAILIRVSETENNVNIELLGTVEEYNYFNN